MQPTKRLNNVKLLTVLALEQVLIAMCKSSSLEQKRFVSMAKLNDRCLFYFVAAMLVSLRRAPTWHLHTNQTK